MLDAIKGLTGGGKAQKQSDDLQGLIAAAREERSALSTMLTQISMRSAKLSQLGKSLEQVDQKAASTTVKLDDIVKRNLDAGRLSYTTSYSLGLEGVKFAFVCIDTPVGKEDRSDLRPIYTAIDNWT